MTHHPNQQTPEADRCRGVDRSLLEFLKPKAEERYSKLEAYCDLLSKASSGAYQSPGTDGALQLLPGQFVATISELARQWQWQRATVRLFISGLTKLGQLSVEPYSKSWLRLPPSRLGHSSELDGSRCSVGSSSLSTWSNVCLFLSRVRTTSSISAPCSSSASSKAEPPPGKWPIPTAVITT